MKYYTLPQASKKATELQEMFKRDNDPPAYRSILNVIRMYFGMRPKVFYFDKKDKKETAMTDRGEPVILKRVYEEDKPKNDLENRIDEDFTEYRW